MNILEKEIEDIVYEALCFNPAALIERGLGVSPKMIHLRQLDLGSYGRADIIGVLIYPKECGLRQIHVHIIECKKEQINIQTLLQAMRYARGIQRISGGRLKNTEIKIHISLIGKTIDTKNDFVYASDIFDNVSFYTYSADLYQGIKFERQCGYFSSNEKLPDLIDQAPFIEMMIRRHVHTPVADLPF